MTNNWINFKDKQPDLDIEILLTDGKERFIGYLTDNFILIKNRPWSNNKITHWMSLPELPKENK